MFKKLSLISLVLLTSSVFAGSTPVSAQDDPVYKNINRENRANGASADHIQTSSRVYHEVRKTNSGSSTNDQIARRFSYGMGMYAAKRRQQ